MNGQNLMKFWSIPADGYVMNVCNLGRGDLDELHIKVKNCITERRISWKTIKQQDIMFNKMRIAEDWKVSKSFMIKLKWE